MIGNFRKDQCELVSHVSDHQGFRENSYNVLFEKQSIKLLLLWHSMYLGPFETASDRACDHYSPIEPSKESASGSLEGNCVHAF